MPAEPAPGAAALASAVRTIGPSEVRAWLRRTQRSEDAVRSIGARTLSASFAEDVLGVPFHLRFTLERLIDEGHGHLDPAALSSIPFYSLCRGLFLPLSMLQPERIGHLFGLRAEPPPDARGREALAAHFLGKDVGLSGAQKLAALLGDPFRGRPGTLQRDSLMRVLSSVRLESRRALLQRLARIGDAAALFAEGRAQLAPALPLTAAEVLEALRFLPAAPRNVKLRCLRSLYERMGRLEAYFLAKLVLRKAGFGFDYQGPVVARAIAGIHGAEASEVEHAMALSDAFHVLEALERSGPGGLKRIQLRPLAAVRPALASASQTVEGIRKFPVWVERKYDGIRLMLHRSQDARGSVLCGAYTRTRADWLEMVRGLEPVIRALPCRDAIVDGEIYGVRIGLDQPVPATVYDVHSALQGEVQPGLSLRYAAFDLLYLNGQDLTELPLSERRRRLEAIVRPLAALPTPLQITVADGQLAKGPHDLKRLYQHFRAQGYEGLIAKDLGSPYRLATRDPSWIKKKPLLTLDLVLLGAVMAVTEKERVGLFGSYVIGARGEEGTWEEVGDVAGVDRERDADIQAEIMREGLLTGRRIERKGASGTRPGLELRPHIVVTVKMEGVVRDDTGKLSLRSPKVLAIRADKGVREADSVTDIEALYLKQRMG